MISHTTKNYIIASLLCGCIYLHLRCQLDKPFFDIFVTDIFESKKTKYYESDLFATRILFIDYLSGGHPKLSSYARDRLVRLTDFEDSESFDVFSKPFREKVFEISKDNAVFYGEDRQVIFCVIGGSKKVSSNYRGVLAKNKTSALIDGFKSHLILLKANLKSDTERKANWGHVNKK